MVAGLLLQISSEVVLMMHTQLQVDTGQHIVYATTHNTIAGDQGKWESTARGILAII